MTKRMRRAGTEALKVDQESGVFMCGSKLMLGLVVLSAAWLTWAAPSYGTDATQYDLEIEQQPLGTALQEFAKQSGVQVVFLSKITDGIAAPEVKGRFTASGALTLLLSSSELTFTELNPKTIEVRTAAMTSNRESAQPSEPSLRLAASELQGTQQSEAANTQGMNPVQSSSAPSTDSPGNDIQEVIVTAQRREERLQNVPISISVLGGDDLDSSTIRGVNEELARVPGVVLQETTFAGATQVTIRGVATQGGIETGASPSAYYLDSVPFGFIRSAFAPTPDAYDLERVEVLRGPQGTLYGANALNGVVRVLTHDADLDSFELKARALTSSTEDGGGNYGGDLAVNVPIINGKLAARAVLGYQDFSGWIDKPHDKDANYAQRRNMRLKINAQPTDELSIALSSWLSRSDFGAPSAGDDNGRSASVVDEPVSSDYDAFGLKIAYARPRFSITSMTSYIDFAHDYIHDFTYGVGFPTRLIETFQVDTFAQEVAITSMLGESWRLSAGAFYRDSNELDVADFPPIFPTPVILEHQSESYAVFGELTRLFLGGQLEFTAGFRYFEDDITQTEESRWGPFTPDELTTVNATFNATTPRFVLGWHPNETMTVYASYSEGFRSGYHQIPDIVANLPFPPVEPDSLTNYELGAKGNLLDRRLAFDAALYFIDWQDIQQTLSVPIAGLCCTSVGVNGESASGLGVDLALTLTPVSALELGLGFSWNDLAVDEDVFSGGILLFDEGDRVNLSAEYTWRASADYVFPIGGAGFKGRLSASVNYASELPSQSLNAEGVVSDESSGDPMLIGRLGLSIHAPDHWTGSLFIDNVNNEQDASVKAGGASYHWARVRPRTIGVQFEYRY